MTVKYVGFSEILIKGKQARVLINPYNPKSVGLSQSKINADITLTTMPEDSKYNFVSKIKGKPYIINGSGEYEVKEVMVLGFAVKNKESKNIIYKGEIDGVRFAHLGGLNSKLTEDEVEELGSIDILFIPIGGGSVLTPQLAADITQSIQPSVVIPIEFKEIASKVEFMQELELVDKFIDIMGSAIHNNGNSIAYKAKDFSETNDSISVVVLK